MPTLKQKALAKELVRQGVEGKPSTLGQSLENAGYSRTTALATPGRVINTPGVQEAIKEEEKTMAAALNKSGITPLKVARHINKLLDAKVKVETFKKGEMMTTVTREDTFAIDKGVTHALKLGVGGGYIQNEQPSVVINFFNNPRLLQIRNAFETQIKEELSSQLEPPLEGGEEE